MKSAPPKRGPAVVRVRHRRLNDALDCDVAVCGGTLGLLVALALQVSRCMHASEIDHASCHASRNHARFCPCHHAHIHFQYLQSVC